MDIKILTDEFLLAETKRLVEQERKLLTEILDHLKEIERRRLYCTLGYGSMYDYAMEHLGYSGDQAHRRISAMRLFREMPEIRGEIQSGELTLTHIGIAQSLFSHEKKQGRELSTEKKAEVFQSIAGLSTRKAKVKVLEFAPEPLPRNDEVKPIASGRNEFCGELSDETLAKLEQLKGLLAHQNPDMSFDELIGKLADVALKELDPAKQPKRKPNPDSEAEISRQIWRRDGHTCTNCGSRHRVDEDHIIPKSMGGPYTLENVRLLCRNCNHRAAIEKLGLNKMERHMRRKYTPPAPPRVP